MNSREADPIQSGQTPPKLRPRLTERGIVQDAEGFLREVTAREIEAETEEPLLAVIRRINQNNNPPSSPAGGKQHHTKGFGSFSLVKSQYDGDDGQGTPKPPISVPE